MKIDAADILANQNQRAEWNGLELDDIELIDFNGNILPITKEEIEEWKFIGLNNIEFIIAKLEGLDT